MGTPSVSAKASHVDRGVKVLDPTFLICEKFGLMQILCIPEAVLELQSIDQSGTVFFHFLCKR